MKKTFDLFEKKLMRATKKTAKKHRWKKTFLSPEIFFFLRNVFFENWQQSKARAWQKKNTCYFW